MFFTWERTPVVVVQSEICNLVAREFHDGCLRDSRSRQASQRSQRRTLLNLRFGIPTKLDALLRMAVHLANIERERLSLATDVCPTRCMQLKFDCLAKRAIRCKLHHHKPLLAIVVGSRGRCGPAAEFSDVHHHLCIDGAFIRNIELRDHD